MTDDPAAARALGERALLALASGEPPQLASRLHRCIGYTHEREGELPRALEHYQAAVLAAERADDREAMADALALRGQMLHLSGDYAGAIGDLERAQALADALGDPARTSFVLNAIARVYADEAVADYHRALGYYRDNLARHQASGDDAETATTLFNIAATLERRGAQVEALDHYARALAIDSARGDEASVAEARRAIGALRARRGETQAGLALIDQALAHQLRRGDADGLARTRLTRAMALHDAGRARDALAELVPVQAHFTASGNQRFLVRVHAVRADALAALGRWSEAYEALALHAALQREIDHALASEGIARLRVAFDLERSEQHNRALRAENAQRRNAEAAASRERRLQTTALILAAALTVLLTALALSQRRSARRFRTLALVDELTGLPNRRNVHRFLGDALATARRDGSPLSVVGFDIDHFKRLNDRFGHDGGDRVLREMARVASSALRQGDRLGRVGGEEFLLVLPGAGPAAAREIAQRMRSAIGGARFDAIDAQLQLSCSFGVASAQAGETIEALLRRADAALYRAKAGGRDRVEVDGDTVALTQGDGRTAPCLSMS